MKDALCGGWRTSMRQYVNQRGQKGDPWGEGQEGNSGMGTAGSIGDRMVSGTAGTQRARGAIEKWNWRGGHDLRASDGELGVCPESKKG